MSALYTLCSGGVGGSDEMQFHPVFTQQFAEPRSSVEANRQRAGFLQFNFQAPFLEFRSDPFNCIVISVRADHAAADAVGEYI